MDLTITPDTYMPSVDENGNYVDNVPIIKDGLFCLCGSRKDKSYDTTSKFAVHIKTKSHQKWLTGLNQNKANYYVELMNYKELVESQQKIITQLENALNKKSLTIDYLTEQLTKKEVCTVNLLDIN